MPQPETSQAEQRLARFCRFFAVVYFALAVLFAGFPGLTWQAVTLGAPASESPQALFWSTSAAALMVALATACLVTAARPRERRHALLPVVTALLASSALAALHLLHASGLASPARRPLLALVLAQVPIFLLTVLVYRGAAAGVHSAPAREAAPPPEPVAAKVQLGSGAPK